MTGVVSDRTHTIATARLLARMTELVDFGDVKLLNLFKNYERQLYCYNYEFWKHITTDFALFMHLDGFIVNPEKWESGFLQYDFIGAPWGPEYKPTDPYRVGNDGFCLKSKRLMNFVATLPWKPMPADILICCHYRREIEDAGFKFAPVEVAARFSVETICPETPKDLKCFGFHGKHMQDKFPLWPTM